MSSAVADLEAGLQAMLQLKPPGVSGSRIQSITALCTANVQSESVLIQKLFTHFKKAPGSHKLGVLYVVDSVTRKWTEQAKNLGQTITLGAEDGTFAAGVNRVKELLPVLMSDIAQHAPEDQKDKIKKLIDIWEKGQTFPLHMLTQFKDKLNSGSTTPPGSPPANPPIFGGLPEGVAQPPASSAPLKNPILEALANLARQNNSGPAPSAAQPQPQNNGYDMSSSHNQYSIAMNPSAPLQSVPSVPLSVNMAAAAAPFALQPAVPGNAAQNFASSQANPYAGASSVVPTGAFDPAIQQQLMVIKALADQGLSADKIAGIMAAMSQGAPNIAAGGISAQLAQYAPQNQNQNVSQTTWGARPDDSRDLNGYHDREAVRSPPGGRYRQRSRSRSPVRGWNARGSPQAHRRDEPSFDYERSSPGRNRGDDRRARGGRSEYRQRSPLRRGHSPSPPESSGGPKWISHDASVPKGSIRVLSRTLFVGGVTTSDHELRRVFDQYGQVQTCIVNKEKRHAFVKMVSRVDAVNAKDMMEKNRSPDSQLRTRWGVGFGPRDCCDYSSGVSTIPITKLTDADRKWMLTAEYGGSGGKPIESGMVVEEPDIEIGQGVSSKAISRRMQTDRGGHTGPKSTRDRDEDDFGRTRPRNDREDRRENERRDGGRKDRGSDVSAPPSMPAIPSFGGFPFTLPNGIPVVPPYGYSGQAQGQAQPPGGGHN